MLDADSKLRLSQIVSDRLINLGASTYLLAPFAPIPYSLFPVPCSLFPVPCSLFPVPCSLFPVPYSRPKGAYASMSLFPIP